MRESEGQVRQGIQPMNDERESERERGAGGPCASETRHGALSLGARPRDEEREGGRDGPPPPTTTSLYSRKKVA